MQKLDFPKDFIWGAATASYQVEGAGHEGGRGECIWDTFSRRPGATYAGENGEVACDQYHRYAEDVALMADLGFGSYRFSIAWPRIMPTGTGKINREGIDYYRRLCDELHKKGIATCATIYHWDLPQPLEDSGGWADRSIVSAFEEYAQICFKELGDVVDRWITINEPYCVAFMGYLSGFHAPGYKDLQKAMHAIHHTNMAHGAAVKAHRAAGLKSPIGSTWNPITPRPATNRPADIQAAEICRAITTETFIYPCLGKGYPELAVKNLGASFPIKDGDMELIAQPIDFIGINYYFEQAASADEKAPFKSAFQPFWQNITNIGWPIVPGGLERQLKWIAEISKGAWHQDALGRSASDTIPIFISENGIACNDEIAADGRVHDKDRVEYLKQHLAVLADLIKAGYNIKGYYAWSLLDNFEWGHGYTKRFGIVHTDYKTMKRTPKDSAYFFRDLIAGYGEW